MKRGIPGPAASWKRYRHGYRTGRTAVCIWQGRWQVMGGSPSASSSDRGFGDAASSGWGRSRLRRPGVHPPIVHGVTVPAALRPDGGSCVGRLATASGFGSRQGTGRERSQHIWRETQCICLKDNAGCPSFGKSIFRTKADHLPYSEGTGKRC